jgi:hypothetical protein
VATKTELLPAPTSTDADRLVQVEAELREAERNFADCCSRVVRYNSRKKDIRTALFNGKVCILVNTMVHDPTLQQLERDRDRSLRNRWELLERRAELMKSLGLIH